MKIRLMRKEDEFREAARKTQEVQLNIDDMTQKIDDWWVRESSWSSVDDFVLFVCRD